MLNTSQVKEIGRKERSLEQVRYASWKKITDKRDFINQFERNYDKFQRVFHCVDDETKVVPGQSTDSSQKQRVDKIYSNVWRKAIKDENMKENMIKEELQRAEAIY